MSEQNATRDLVCNLVQAMVDDPKAVKVDMLEGTQATVFEVRVHPEDMRRVIGRQGRTADAIREILTNLGGKAGRRFMLELVEPSSRLHL